MIKAILFDMDGVLIDAKEWHYEALNRALELFGYNISRDSHLSTFDGLPTHEKLRILSRARGLPEGLQEFLNELKQTYTLEIIHQRCKPVFIHQYALSRLKQDGYMLAVCSNSVSESIKTMMKLSNLITHLDLIISNQDVERGKPDPEMYLKAMNILNVAPTECLILEDNEHGIQAGISSGGHLLRISTPDDVTYKAIKDSIRKVEEI